MDFLLHILITAAIYSLLALSLDLLIGHTGLLSIAQAASYGLGAYCSALISGQYGAPFAVGILAGLVTASVLSLLVSLPAARLRGDYLMMVTFAFQMIAFGVFKNWTSVTRGPLGIPGVPRPTIFGVAIDSQFDYAALTFIILGLAHFLSRRITLSPFGRVLRAIREDELFAQSLGKSTLATKIKVIAMSAALAALAGSLFAHYVSFVDPTSFTLMESVLVITMVIVGGAGSLWGPAAGATLLITLPELLRFAGFTGAYAANLRLVIYGLLLLLILRLRPQGLLGQYVVGR